MLQEVMSSSTNPVLDILRAGLEAKKKEIAKLEEAIRHHEAEEAAALNGGKPRRFRKATGFKPGSIPSLVYNTLHENSSPMSASELSDALRVHNRVVDSSQLAASISRYVGKVFRRDEEGKYLLVR
jgi:hypothetical protein